MNIKTGIWGFVTLLGAVLFFIRSAPQASGKKTQATHSDSVKTNWPSKAGNVTTIRVNGRSADVFLNDSDTNGFLNVSRDQIANTSALDFSYATLDATHPNLVILVQGAGDIPNSAYTTSSTTAHLSVTTTFPVNRCLVNLDTAEFHCDPSIPITFNLAWLRNDFGSVSEKTMRIETFGPVTTKFKGEYESQTARVNGTWEGFTASENIGNLVDSQNSTLIREITMKAHP